LRDVGKLWLPLCPAPCPAPAAVPALRGRTPPTPRALPPARRAASRLPPSRPLARHPRLAQTREGSGARSSPGTLPAPTAPGEHRGEGKQPSSEPFPLPSCRFRCLVHLPPSRTLALRHFKRSFGSGLKCFAESGPRRSRCAEVILSCAHVLFSPGFQQRLGAKVPASAVPRTSKSQIFYWCSSNGLGLWTFATPQQHSTLFHSNRAPTRHQHRPQTEGMIKKKKTGIKVFVGGEKSPKPLCHDHFFKDFVRIKIIKSHTGIIFSSIFCRLSGSQPGPKRAPKL